MHLNSVHDHGKDKPVDCATCCSIVICGVITNDMSDYINVFVRIAHIICNHPLYKWIL